jgi:AcrR family transcriptional regulator
VGAPASERGAARPGPRRSLLRQERSKETRRLLIRTAARLWSEQGYDDVTVEDICSTAGVGRTTFYLYFQSKERLLAALAAGTAMGVEDDVQAAGGLDAQLDAFITGVARRMGDVPTSLAELVIHSYRTQVRAEHPSGGRRFADILGDVLAAAADRGELATGDDTGELGEILGALTMDAIEAWAGRDGGGPSLESVLRFRFALVLDRYR